MTDRHIYEIYIKANPQAVWNALTKTEFTKRYFHNQHINSSWQVGEKITFESDDGSISVDGALLICDPPRKLSFTWKYLVMEAGKDEPASRVTYEIEPLGDFCRLSLVHDQFIPGSKVLEKVSQGWSVILCNLKSLLETGSPMALSLS